MERAIIYCAKTGLEATDHFVPELLEKYCKDNGYEIVAMLSEPASTEGVSFPMKYAFIGLNMEEDVNTIITLSKDMIGATEIACNGYKNITGQRGSLSAVRGSYLWRLWDSHGKKNFKSGWQNLCLLSVCNP